jgi:hypothetical protein
MLLNKTPNPNPPIRNERIRNPKSAIRNSLVGPFIFSNTYF